MAKTEEPVSFTAREMEVLALAWQCFDSEPRIDIKKLAQLTGYTEGSASVTMGKIKRKLKMHAGGTSDDNPTSTPKKTAPPKTPKSSGKRGATGPANDETPSKKKKKKGGKQTMMQQEDDDEEYGSFKVKKEETNELLKGADEYFLQTNGGYGAYEEEHDTI